MFILLIIGPILFILGIIITILGNIYGTSRDPWSIPSTVILILGIIMFAIGLTDYNDNQWKDYLIRINHAYYKYDDDITIDSRSGVSTNRLGPDKEQNRTFVLKNLEEPQ